MQQAHVVLITLVWKTTGLVPSTSLDAGGISLPHQYETADYREPRPRAPKAPAGRMEYLRERYRGQKLSEKASALMLESWCTKTNRSYDSLFGRWVSWCRGRESGPFSGPITNVANFLASLDGYQYNSINSYRSAISSVHEKVDRYSIGQHPMISRLMKGVFHSRPPLPRYTASYIHGM